MELRLPICIFDRLLSMWIAGGLVVLIGCGGEEPGRAPDLADISIRYPTAGETVREDEIPVWLVSDRPELFERMTVRHNGSVITPRFLPWGGRKNGIPETVGWIEPRPGANHLEVVTGSAEGNALRRSVRFSFEPRPLRVLIRVLENGRDVPARVSLHGIGETPTPRLVPAIWEEIAQWSKRKKREHLRNFVYTEGAPYVLHLLTGRYELLASRGPAYSVARAEIGPESGEVTLEIQRILDTRGWVSADFHVHAIPSGDSSLSLSKRLASYVSQDVDVIVASDHHTITDYEAELGADKIPPQFEAIPGVETSYKGSGGHWTLWPLARDETDETRVFGYVSRAYGGFAWSEVGSPSALFTHFHTLNAVARRERFGDFPVVIQLNHPRGIRFARSDKKALRPWGHLNRIGYNPDLPLDPVGNGALLARELPGAPRAIDVDAIELLNRLAYDRYLRVRTDWFAWMSQGFVPTATANTDSHWLVLTEAGYPRNWVRYGEPLPVRAEELARAVRTRQVVGTTGPLVLLEPRSEDGRPLTGPLATLGVTVRTPPWMPVEEIRVFVNGELRHSVPAPRGPPDPYAREQHEFRVDVPVAIRSDAFLTVEVGDRVGELLSLEPHPPPLGRMLPDVKVLAFTNALLIDVDGDGSPWGTAERQRSKP